MTTKMKMTKMTAMMLIMMMTMVMVMTVMVTVMVMVMVTLVTMTGVNDTYKISAIACRCTTVWQLQATMIVLNPQPPPTLLKGSWDLVTRAIIRVTLLITTYNPN